MFKSTMKGYSENVSKMESYIRGSIEQDVGMMYDRCKTCVLSSPRFLVFSLHSVNLR